MYSYTLPRWYLSPLELSEGAAALPNTSRLRSRYLCRTSPGRQLWDMKG